MTTSACLSLSLLVSPWLACEVLNIIIIICMFQNSRWSNGLKIPRSEIPKWFSHQNVGASLDLPMPLDLYSRFMGIAVSVVFVLHPHHPLYQFTFTINFNEGLRARGLFLSEEALSHTDANGLYHLWLKFYPFSFWNCR